MVRNLTMSAKDFQTSFLSCEKDTKEILEHLFIKNKPYSNRLKRLLVANTKDCLEDMSTPEIQQVDNMTLPELYKKGYIRLTPKLSMSEHEEVKSYIIITFDNFTATSNPQFKDCTISFDILCHTDYQEMGQYRLRPIQIMGYIDGILNGARLTGIGKLEFVGSKSLMLDETLSGYTLMYRAVHGSDDQIPQK